MGRGHRQTTRFTVNQILLQGVDPGAANLQPQNVLVTSNSRN
jgi:hypothetical protein